MNKKYVVEKQFAKDSNIFSKGDIVEMLDSDAAEMVAKGLVKEYVEEKSFKVEVDSKAISDAVVAGFAAIAPKAKEEKKMTYGEYLQGIAKKTINITTNTQGQYATTTLWDPMIDVDLLKESGIASRAAKIALTGTNNIYKKNVINSTGTAPAIVAESNPTSASQPTITQFSFTLQKLTYAFVATEEALEDTGALVSEVISAIPEQFSKYVEDGMINGAGPLTGVVGDTNTVSIAKEVGQTDGTIVAENIDKMFVAAKNPLASVWVMSRSAYAAIQGVEDSAGNRLFQGPNQIGVSPFGTLKGLPILVSDYCQAVGTVGDIILGEWSKYQLVSKGDLRVASSAELRFLYDEITYKFAYRLAGKPVGLKLTATDSSEMGNFVTLQNRGS